MLKIRNLNKSFSTNKVLRGLNLDLEENKIYGLLGRNGVGKTTLLNIVANQIKRDGGEVNFYGEELYENPRAVADICLVREKKIAAGDMKVKDIFKIAKILYKNWDEAYKDYLVREFNLDLKKKYDKLSRGNQTIVGLIIGLASRAKLTIFDEPALGLDAAHRDDFYNLILSDWEKNPRTIIISTHLIDEVTNLFEEVIILKEGNIFIKEEVPSLLEKAYYLKGKGEDIRACVDIERIIYKESFGNTEIIGIFQNLSKEDKTSLRKKDVEISPIPLQKLFIYLTESPSIKEVS